MSEETGRIQIAFNTSKQRKDAVESYYHRHNFKQRRHAIEYLLDYALAADPDPAALADATPTPEAG